MVDVSLLKNTSGTWLINPLFYEMSDADKSRVLYTLKPEDHKGFPSIRRLYIEMGDETEYRFASEYFGGWPHWQKLLNSPWFSDFIQDLRAELAQKQLSDRLEVLKKKSAAGDVNATRFLLNEEYKKKKSQVGRPTKEAIKREADLLFMSSEEISDDLARITAQLESGAL